MFRETIRLFYVSHETIIINWVLKFLIALHVKRHPSSLAKALFTILCCSILVLPIKDLSIIVTL